MNKDDEDFLDKHWKKLIAIIYVGMILTLGIIGHQVYTSPYRDLGPVDDVIVRVHNEKEETLTLTVKMIGDFPFSSGREERITSFDVKEVSAGETVEFTTEVSDAFENYPFKILVGHPDDMDRPMATKDVYLTVGYDSGNENEFHLTVS